jgi:hypothetical protein
LAGVDLAHGRVKVKGLVDFGSMLVVDGHCAIVKMRPMEKLRGCIAGDRAWLPIQLDRENTGEMFACI